MIKKVAYSIIIGDNNNISPFPILEGFDYFIFSKVMNYQYILMYLILSMEIQMNKN